MPNLVQTMKTITLDHASKLGHDMTDFVKSGANWRSICKKKGCKCLIWLKKDGDHGGTALETRCEA